MPCRWNLVLAVAGLLTALPLGAQEQRVRTPYVPAWGQVPLEQVEAQVARFPGVGYLHGKADQRVVALTYDDGPGLETPALLDVLKRLQVKATFFWQGQTVIKSPGLVKRALDEGHTLGNHSWNHPYLNKEPQESYWKTQIENTQMAFEKRIGKRPRFFRPPYGFVTDRQIQDFAAKGMKIIGYSVASDDWFYTHELSEADAVNKIAGQVVDYIHPGAIVVMHDSGGKTRIPTIKATERIIAKLKSLGYRFVTVDELVGVSPYL